MDILDRLLGHDAWTTHHLLERCCALSDEQFDQPFDIGHGSLRATFTHIIGNIEVWTALMLQGPINAGSDMRTTPAPILLARLKSATAAFATFARTLADEQRLDELWVDSLDDPPTQKTYGGAIAHVITHNMAHRSEILHILARLGVPNLIEGDLLSWEQQERQKMTTNIFVSGQKAQVSTPYQAMYADPIMMQRGDQVSVEERPSEWSGWIWCTHTNGKTGWVPESYLQRSGDTAVALRDYFAVELSVDKDEELTLVEFTSGWYLATNRAGQQGWVPAENILFK